MNSDKFKTSIKLALEHRSSVCSKLSVFRLFDGIADAIPDLYIDYYDGAILAHYLPKNQAAEKLLPQIEESLKLYLKIFSKASIYIRVHPLDSQKHKELGARIIAGPEIEETIVSEGALKYYLNIPRSPHAGLYADMREVRENLSLNYAERVINLFAFTGSLGLAAALGGAKEVLQVDSNPAAINWARKNQILNQDKLKTTEIKYFCNDSLLFLKRELALIKKGLPKANLIICDPPSFGRSATGSFSFKNDAYNLAKLCLSTLAPNGRLIFTCNSRQFSAEIIAEIINSAAADCQFPVNNLHLLEPPIIDFPAKHSDSIAMRGIILN